MVALSFYGGVELFAQWQEDLIKQAAPVLMMHRSYDFVRELVQ